MKRPWEEETKGDARGNKARGKGSGQGAK